MNDINDAYAGYYLSLNTLTEKGYEDAARGYQALYKRFMPQDRSARILDIGCGAGQFLYYLKKADYQDYYGIDISPALIDCCKKITDNAEVADAFDFLTDKKGRYDLIVMNDLLEHIARDKAVQALRLAKESLAANGVVIIKVPNMANPFGLLSRYKDMTHETGFTEDSLHSIFYAAGFHDITCYPASASMSSLGGLVGKFAETLTHASLRLLFKAQGYPAPRILTANLIGVARKSAK